MSFTTVRSYTKRPDPVIFFVGGVSGFVMTGSLKGALIGAVTGAAFAGVGNAFSAGGKFAGAGSKFVNAGAHVGRSVANTLTTAGRILKVGLHGVVGGMSSVLSGGKFKTGFLSAGFTQGFAPSIDNLGSSGGRILAAGLVGGGAAELAGGKFKDGFIIGMSSRAFNDEASGHGFQRDRVRGRFGLFGSMKAKLYGFLGIEVDLDLVSFHTGSNPSGSNPLMTQGVGVRFNIGDKSIGLSASRNSTDGGGTWSDWDTQPFVVRDVSINSNGGVDTTFGIGLGVGIETDIEVISGAL